jgi:hypothetical protein
VEALSLLACCFISWVVWPLLGMVCAGEREELRAEREAERITPPPDRR